MRGALSATPDVCSIALASAQVFEQLLEGTTVSPSPHAQEAVDLQRSVQRLHHQQPQIQEPPGSSLAVPGGNADRRAQRFSQQRAQRLLPKVAVSPGSSRWSAGLARGSSVIVGPGGETA
ncbi:MAG: hypothetical protein ACRDZ4_00970 [Egibacteraceae bacterium]